MASRAAQKAYNTSIGGFDGARFNQVDVSNAILIPVKGQNILIENMPRRVPSAGVTINVANLGLTAYTNYCVYAYMSSGIMTLEASTTQYVDNGDGVAVKSGDTTRTLVGAIGMTASGAILGNYPDSGTQGVRSWYNDRGLTLHDINATSIAISSTTISAISGAPYVGGVLWPMETAVIECSAAANIVSATIFYYLRTMEATTWNGSATTQVDSVALSEAGAANQYCTASVTAIRGNGSSGIVAYWWTVGGAKPAGASNPGISASYCSIHMQTNGAAYIGAGTGERYY